MKPHIHVYSSKGLVVSDSLQITTTVVVPSVVGRIYPRASI